MAKLLLLSNSTNPGGDFLSWPESNLIDFLRGISRKILFIPYAAVNFSFDEYAERVSARFQELGFSIISAHASSKPVELLNDAGAVVVGGGNTFHLLKHLQETGLLDGIKTSVSNGLPYVGWSAGSNISCPTICTTNDMPIVEPHGFAAFDFLPFQINPHYTDLIIQGHGGETRDQRIAEYLAANPSKTVVGLREGSLFRFQNGTLELFGDFPARVFTLGNTFDISVGSDCQFLLNR